MAAGTLTTAQIPNAVDRRIKKHFRDTYPTVEPMLEKIFKMETQEDKNEYEQDYQGLGRFETTAEGERFKSDNFGEGYQTVYIPVKKTKLVDVTWESTVWDKSAITKAENIGAEIARAAAQTIEEDAASVFLNGFSSGTTSYGDSKPLFSIDHTRPDGGTAQSNASANGVPFSGEALEAAIVALRGQKNKRGRLILSRPRVLLVPPELEAEAIRVTKSTLRSGVNDNDANVFRMKEYKGGMLADNVIVWDYLSAAAGIGGTGKHWFVLDTDLHMITWKWKEKPMIEKDETTGKQNDLLYYLAKYYASKGWSDWVGTWGSKGDGQAYSS